MNKDEAAKQGHTGIKVTCTGSGSEYSPMWDEVRPGKRAEIAIAPGTELWLIESSDTGTMVRVVTDDGRFTGWMYCFALKLGGK